MNDDIFLVIKSVFASDGEFIRVMKLINFDCVIAKFKFWVRTDKIVFRD